MAISYWPLAIGFSLFGIIGCKSAIEQDELPWPMHTIDSTSFGSDGTKLGDANGDGSQDIICGWEQGGVARLYVHPKNDKKWPYVEVPAPDVEDALLVDLDGNGKQDIVTFSEGQYKRITLHWAPEPHEYMQSDLWTSVDVPSTVDRTKWMFGQPMNVDNQHGIDLIVGGKNENAMLGWLEGPKDARDIDKWQLHQIAEVGWIMSIFTRDIDGDGRKDVIISDRKGEKNGIKWFRHPGLDSSLLRQEWEEHLIGLQGFEPMFINLTDADNDGLSEIWAIDLKEGIFHFQQTDVSGLQWEMKQYPLPTEAGSRGKSIVTGDINADGHLDLVTTYEGAEGKSGVMWSEFDERQNQLIHHDISGPAGIKFDFVVLLDMDNDGDLDVLTSEENNNSKTDAGLGVIWYENR